MVYDNPPSFGDIIAGIGEIQSAVNAWQVVRHLTENIGSRESRGANVEMGRKGTANRVLLTIIPLTGIKHPPTALFISVQGENNATW